MINLPETKDDMRNILQAVHMMEIPDENMFVEEDIGFDKVNDLYHDLTYKILARTRELQPRTGICGGAFFF